MRCRLRKPWWLVGASMLARTTVVVAALLTAACAGGPARSPMASDAVWRELESEHFRLVTDLDMDVAEGELERFEQAYDAMVQAAFPRGAMGRLRLVVFRTSEELHAFVPNAVGGLFVDGWTMEDDETGTALFAVGLRATSRAVFQHELAHRLLAAGFAEVPPWFEEGLATYFESMRVERGRVILGDWAQPPAPLSHFPSVRTLTALDRSRFYGAAMRRDLSEAEAQLVSALYNASWHLVHLLRNGPDAIRNRFRAVIASINDGHPFEPAFRAFVHGVGEQALEQAFRDHSQDLDRLSSVFAFTPSPRGGRPTERKLGRVDTHLLSAKILLAGPTPRRALLEVDEALRHEPRSLEARLIRAHVQLVLGDVAGATEAFATLVAEAPTKGAPVAGLLRALLESREAPAAAERIGDLASRLASIATTADEHTMAVYGLAMSGQTEPALAASVVATRAHPTSFRLLAARGELLAQARRYRDAMRMIRLAMQAMPERLVRGEEGHALAQRLNEYRRSAEADPEDNTQVRDE